ncbi:hypothetical protein [Methanobrevibacter sp.]|uniref:hypothetical protein n=1 Tax=Methanobrevibacter sp. TaxID=66852 RepID=UPI00386DD188
MNSNLKQILEQIEYIKKSQYSLINYSLESSRLAAESMRALTMCQPNIIDTAALVRDSMESSRLAIESIKSLDMYRPNIINTATMLSDSMESSRLAIESIESLDMYRPNIINTAILMRDSIENSKSIMDNLRMLDAYTPSLVNNALLMRNSLDDIQRIAQEFSILKYTSIIDFVNNLDLNLISQSYEKRFFGRYTRQFDLFIRNSGWLIPNCASEDFIESLYSSFDNDEDIDAKFVDYFSDNDFEVILELKEKWNSEDLIPEGNLKIISNAIDLILNDNGREYSDIIIPSLLAQIDVLISEVLIKNGFNEVNRKFYSEIYGSKDKSNIRTFRENFAGNIIDNWEEHHVNFLLENLFANNYGSDLKEPLILNFNRHNILHGLDDEYGTFENLIRCLLVIDFLNDFLSDDLCSRLN